MTSTIAKGPVLVTKMKTVLPGRSLLIKSRLDFIVHEILAVGKDKIAMIILFGSYARGDWVRHIYTEGHITYSYQSDFDIMLVLKKGKYAGYQARNMQYKIEDRLEKKLAIDIMKDPSVTLVLEPITRVNEQLDKGQYFFSDVIKEGILLYDSGEFTLSPVREELLPWEERRAIAEEDYQSWFTQGKNLLIGVDTYLKINDYRLAAFLLHQATESFYNAILLVFSGYKPKSHDILDLAKKARNYHYQLFRIFPYETPEQKECFTLLKDAYVKARYDKNYKITEEQLQYLIGRVEELKSVTEKICLEKLS